MPGPRIFDCHSHWGTAKAHIFRTPEELARQEKIWKTKGRHWAEDEMMDYLRRNNVRAILDLSFPKALPIDQMREYHDYAFDIARRNRDVVFGHWLQFDSRRWGDARDEFKRALDANAGFIGFAIAGQTLGQPASDPSWFPFYELAIDTGTPVMIMTGLTGIGQGAKGGHGMLLDDGHPRHIDFAAARYPELRVLAARPAYPWQDEMIAVLLHKANVMYELHGWGPKHFSPALKREIKGRLQDRIVFGCDFPFLRYERMLEAYRAEGYPEEVLKKLMHLNAENYFPGASWPRPDPR